MSRLRLLLLLSVLCVAAAPAAAQDVESRLRAIEARVAALEGRASPAQARAAVGPACRRLNVNASQITPGSTLTVTVNGTTIATYDENAYGDLEPFMRPGPNTVVLSFAAPGGPGTNAELRCLPPGVASSRTAILTLKPTAKRLSAQAQVILQP